MDFGFENLVIHTRLESSTNGALPHLPRGPRNTHSLFLSPSLPPLSPFLKPSSFADNASTHHHFISVALPPPTTPNPPITTIDHDDDHDIRSKHTQRPPHPQPMLPPDPPSPRHLQSSHPRLPRRPARAQARLAGAGEPAGDEGRVPEGGHHEAKEAQQCGAQDGARAAEQRQGRDGLHPGRRWV